VPVLAPVMAKPLVAGSQSIADHDSAGEAGNGF